jgi:hypothetical protein
VPIRKDLRKFYGREWRTVTRPRILARAHDRCEQCCVPNGAKVARLAGWWSNCPGYWSDEKGRRQSGAGRFFRIAGQLHWVRIVLSVAHLNHVAGDDRDENLKALCQYCHLHFDAAHHKETRATRKDKSRPILAKLQDQGPGRRP